MEITDLDLTRLAQCGITNVRPSERAPFPAIEFDAHTRPMLLTLTNGDIVALYHWTGNRIVTARYSSSLETMRFRLDGWEDCPHPYRTLRNQVAYMAAMLRHALAVQHSMFADFETRLNEAA